MNLRLLSKRFTIVLLLSAGIFLFVLTLAGAGVRTVAGVSSVETSLFFPVVFKPVPAPAVPRFVQNIPLPGAQCPNVVFVNEVTDYVYIANNFSHNISFLRGTNHLGNVSSGGQWPTRITMMPENGRTFVTNLHRLSNSNIPSPLAEFDGTTLLRTYAQKFEGYTPLYNTVNQYLYVTDLDSNIRVLDASVLPATFVKDIGRDDGVQGWIKAITYDPESGLVYAASWDKGELYVIDGLEVKAVINTQAWGPDQLLFDPVRKYVYVAGQEVRNRPPGYPPYNVTVFNAQVPYQFLGGFTTSLSTHRLAYDPISGFVYAANPLVDSVTVLDGLQLVGTIPVGDFPYAMTVNPNTGYVFVANTNSHTISIIRDGLLVTTIPSQGIRPYAMDVDTRNNTVYVANRGTEGHLACQNDASVTILR